MRSLGRPRPVQRVCTWRLCPVARARQRVARRAGGDSTPVHGRRRGGGSPAWRRRRDGDERRATATGDVAGCGPSDAARTTAVGTAVVGAAACGARRSGNGWARRGARWASGGREATVGAARRAGQLCGAATRQWCATAWAISELKFTSKEISSN